MTKIINKLRKLIITEDPARFNDHISLVVKYSKQLANIEDEKDIESIEIAALLHDIGRIRYGGKEHNLTGAKDARVILEKENYPIDKIEKICDSIISHGGTKEFPIKNKFSEILRSADGLSHHDVVPLFLMFQLKKTNGNLKKSIEKLIEKLYFEWNNKITLDNAKNIGKEKYESAILILKSNLKII